MDFSSNVVCLIAACIDGFIVWMNIAGLITNRIRISPSIKLHLVADIERASVL